MTSKWTYYYKHHYGYYCAEVKVAEEASETTTYKSLENQRGNTNDHVERCVFKQQPLQTFPRNWPENFLNLKSLVIDGCGLNKLSKADLVGLLNLEILDLENNRLTSLPDDLFEGMGKLSTIHFENNPLERLSGKLLQPIQNTLVYAYFDNCNIIDDFFNRDWPGRNNLTEFMKTMDSLGRPLPDKDYANDQQITRKFAEFKRSDLFSDYSIKIHKEEFKIHKAFLAAKSPVFYKAFTSDNALIDLTTKMKSFSDCSIGSFLDFFYSDEIGGEVNAMQVFGLSIIFEVGALKAICADRILASLSQANALEIYNFSHRYGLDQMKRRSFKEIKLMFPELPENMTNRTDDINQFVESKRRIEIEKRKIDVILGTNARNKRHRLH